MGRRLVRLQCPANMGSRCCGRLTVGPGTATHPKSMDSCRCLLCDPGSCECPLRRVLESLSMGLSLEHCRRCRNRAPFRLENRPDQRPAFSHIITAFRATFSHIPTLSGQRSFTSRSARAVIGVVILCLGSGEPFSRIPRRAAQRPASSRSTPKWSMSIPTGRVTTTHDEPASVPAPKWMSHHLTYIGWRVNA